LERAVDSILRGSGGALILSLKVMLFSCLRVFCCLLALAMSALADGYLLGEVHVGQSELGGFHFDIQALAPGDGVVRFHIMIAKDLREYDGLKVQLGKVVVGPGESLKFSVVPSKDLPIQLSDQGLVCDFTVPEQSLNDDPDLCFIFTTFSTVPTRRVHKLTSLTSHYYVRLKGAVKKP
jgi:hypothetical protein